MNQADYKKKYEQLKRFVNDLYPHMSDYCKEKIGGYFHKSAENEDERIRKEIIDFLDELFSLGKNTNFDKWSKSDCAEWIAWLKKQGQSYTKKDVDDAWLKGICDAKREVEKQAEKQKTKIDLIMWKPVSEYTGGRVLTTNGVDILVGYIDSDGDCESEDCEGTFLCGIIGFVNIENILPKPKQGEHKLADKVEPKFKKD